MKKSVLPLLATVAGLALSTTDAAAAPKVVASIKPVHSLVAAIMGDVGEPSLIVEGAASPHTYSLKPSNAKALQDAEVVFWVGHGLEAFLEKPLEALAGKAKVVELEDAPGITLLPFREGGAFESHDHEDEHADEEAGHDDHANDHVGEHAGEQAVHKEPEAEDAHHHEGEHDHDHSEYDMHFWLDPMNAKAMAVEIERVLAEADPVNAPAYKTNLDTLSTSLDALDSEVTALVAPIKDKPFIVFHDAYQYFEKRYDVRVAGSITVSPELAPGAERVSEIHAKIAELGAACVFAEPQFEPKLVNVVIEGTTAKAGTLDPEGGSLTEGPDLYPTLIRNIARSLKDCLAG